MFRLEIDDSLPTVCPWTTEVAKYLRSLAAAIEATGDTEGDFRDSLGNCVGVWSIDPVDTPEDCHASS